MCSSSGIRNDLTRLDPVFAEYEGVYGSLISILQGAQDIYGYLPDDVLLYIAEKTGNTIAQVRGVATFYAQFRFAPVGKYLFQLCAGTACHVNGADSIEKAICEELGVADGDTTDDGLFSLKTVACLGCCSLSPVMMINEETYGSLTPSKTVEILRELKGREA
jgi:NADH-quinone oxidoreductase subunit E